MPSSVGNLEYAVLVDLWKRGAGSARQIYEQVGRPSGLVYTTVAKVLDRLHAKNLVDRERAGKAFIYRPAVRRETLERARARQILDRLLGTEAQPAIATLVDAMESKNPELLDELARAVEARRRSRRGT